MGLATFSLFGLPFLLRSIPFMTPPLLLSTLGALPPGSPSPSVSKLLSLMSTSDGNIQTCFDQYDISLE